MDEEEKEDSNKREFHCWQYLIPELRRLCIGCLNLTDLGAFDTACSNRKELTSLLQFFKSHITNRYEFKSLESLIWASKRFPKISNPRLLLPKPIRGRLTTFDYICQKPGLENITRLLIGGIAESNSINQQDSLEMTCLHYACREGRMENVKLLLSKGAILNCRDIYGRTPVFIACLRQHDELYEFLAREMKADLTKASYGGQTVQDLLEERARVSAANQPSHWDAIPVSVLAAAFFFFYYKRWWELIQELFK